VSVGCGVAVGGANVGGGVLVGGSGVSVGSGLGVAVGGTVGMAVSNGMGVNVSVGVGVGLGVGVKVGKDRPPEAAARDVGCAALALLSTNQIASPEPNTMKLPTKHNPITIKAIIRTVESFRRILTVVSQKFIKQDYITNRLSAK